MIDFDNFTSLIQIADYFNTDEICKQTIAEEFWAAKHRSYYHPKAA